ANLHTTTYQYDQLGRRIARTLPAGQSESYVYDAAGNLKSKTDFNGKTTTYAYDTSNRLLSKTPDPSFNANPITFTYFPNGLRQTMGDPSGATTYAYDNRNRLTSKVTPFGTLSYTYDAGGDLLTLKSSNSGGASDTYTYDQLNRLSTVTDAAGGTTYAYDAVGNLQNFSYPNGVTHAYSYDPLNRLTQVGAAKNSSSVSNYAYTLGAAGNRLTVAELSGRSVAYNYDSLYRLTSEAVSSDPANKNGTISFTYDAVGNRKTLSSTLPPAGGNVYTYDADDRLGSDQYDANGNTTSSFGVADAYDFENHLIQKGSVTVVYDGDGNRVSETVGGVTTNYLVDTQNPTGYAQVVDELQSGSVSRTYSYGLERVSETQSINSTLTTSFYGYDGHGSVRQLTNSSGAVTDSYEYDAFGNLSNSTGSTPNNYLFAGEQYDPALALYYNRARYFNSATGRFWGMDTEDGQDRDPLSLHKYLYAEGNPVDNLDPSGNEIDEVMGGLGMMDTINAIPIISLRVIVALKRALLYQVVVVTPSSGAAYEPQSKVKNSAQAVVSGWPVGTPIRIAVPPGIDPQTMVDQWRSSSAWSSRSALNPRTWFAFKKFWSDPANNFKSRSAIFDAFGNFEFGATGAAAFFGLPALEAAADYLHGGTNDPINRTDIASGYEAIEKGGKLSTTAEKLVP
ncbi:MAG TPA: RHS repeat-associated core domain-containing protein, partial [Terriglobales bacterium]|nr:RHS repeat-associated core domain-containing protein [Terriglobales bacterium]